MREKRPGEVSQSTFLSATKSLALQTGGWGDSIRSRKSWKKPKGQCLWCFMGSKLSDLKGIF